MEWDHIGNTKELNFLLENCFLKNERRRPSPKQEVCLSEETGNADKVCWLGLALSGRA